MERTGDSDGDSVERVMTMMVVLLTKDQRVPTMKLSYLPAVHMERTCDIYESFSDVGEIRVYFASKILMPCRMH